MGDKDVRDALIKQLQTGKDDTFTELDFGVMRPIPDGRCWYGWCVDNWGTKWNAYHLDRDHGDDETVYVFQTAWSPPSESMVREFMEKHYPVLKWSMHYAEQGMNVYGRYGSFGPSYHEKFKDADYKVPCGEYDDEWEAELVGDLTVFQDLYDMSG